MIIIWQFSFHIPYQPSALGLIWVSRVDMGVSGWYGVWYENCHIIIYLSYILLSDKFAYLISYAKSKARPPIWWYGFLAQAKSSTTHVSHYHTFCAPQEWYVLESHVSIRYAKLTYFLVNVWWWWILPCKLASFDIQTRAIFTNISTITL